MCVRERELSCGLRLVFMCVGLKQAVVGKEVRNKMLPTLRLLVTDGHIRQETLPWPRVLPPLGVFYLRSSECYWDRPRQCPRKPCWAPTRAYPKSRGPGGGDLLTPEAPVPLAPLCILQVFHFSGLNAFISEKTDVFPVRFQ